MNLETAKRVGLNVIGGSAPGFAYMYLLKVLFGDEFVWHKPFGLPRDVVYLPTAILSLWSVSDRNPYSDNKWYDVGGGLAAIIAMWATGQLELTTKSTAPAEVVLDSHGLPTEYPADVNKFRIVNDQIYWQGRPIALDLFEMVVRCLEVKRLPSPVFETVGAPSQGFLDSIGKIVRAI